MSEPDSSSGDLPKRLDAAGLDLWREAMAHLRHLSDDVWKGLRLFLILNAFNLISIVAFCCMPLPGHQKVVLLAILAVAGALLTVTARSILKRHRIYYLQMLAKKSLLEAELGFYQRKIAGSGTDLSFPWRLTPEVVAEIKQNFEGWVQKSVRARGTIARAQFLIYEILIGLYCLVFLFAVIRLLM